LVAGAISRSSSCPPARFAVGVLVHLNIEVRIAGLKMNFSIRGVLTI
jgi:hypothetical protein